MIVVYHGILPFDRSRHRGMMAAYGDRIPLVYVDPDSERNVAPSRQADAVASQLARDARPGIYPVTLGSTLPGGRFRPVAKANRWLGLRSLLSRLRRETGQPVVLISQQPGLLATVKGIGATLTVYEIRDDYVSLALTQDAADRTQIAHDRLLEQSDLVWAISRALVDAATTKRTDVQLIGVGVEHADFVASDASRAPDAIRSLQTPRIGLVGNLNDRVDWRLLENVARARPNWQILVVGPVYHSSDATRLGLKNLTALANAHHVEAVPQDMLGACMAALDVCLIPYRLTQATSRINSLKVYQYLSVGKPVIATRIPSIMELADVVACVEADAFVAAIDDALVEDKATGTEKRRLRAAQFDWSAIVAEQLGYLEQRLDPTGYHRR
jgi:glycosyltransferase involved in cell wall biosynthesis